jgi:cytochrome c biogenesis protein
VLDFFQVFTTYSSVWFSAIYLLLFISLIGCVIPRTKHHFDALVARPPKTPARLDRLTGFIAVETSADAAAVVDSAERLLRKQGYRTERYPSRASGSENSGTTDSVSAERGYWRETGNLVFHAALVGILVAVGIGGGFGYSGQKVLVEGQAFANVRAGYDSFDPGRFFDDSALEGYSLRLDEFSARYEENNLDAYGQPIDFTASVTARLQDGEPVERTVKVNEPLHIGGTDVFLLGNGYAPVLTVRNAEGDVVWSNPTPFLAQDSQLTSLGIIKIPDGLDEQIGLRGFLYPTAIPLESGALASSHPELRAPTLTLEVYSGDVRLEDGAFTLNLDGMTQIAGREADADTLVLEPGDVVDLPNGLGSIELTSIPRFASFDIHHDPTQAWVLAFAMLVLAGLLTSLFIPRRRVWVKAVPTEAGARVEYAGLARGEDPGLELAVTELADKHSQSLGLRLER